MFVFYPGFNPKTDNGLFDKPGAAIINTVNCQGTSKNSAGVAGQVFRQFDGVHKSYMNICNQKKFFPGGVQMLEVNPSTGERETGGGQWVFNVATKDHWKDDSKLEWVEDILKKLPKAVERTGVKSLALPPLGCGHGGLDWDKQVGPLVLKHLAPLQEKGVMVHVFASDPDKSKEFTRSVPPSKNRKGSPQFWPEGVTPPAADETNWYAGIGARPRSPRKPDGAPKPVLNKMEKIGEILANEGWGLRSGAAAGSDKAFEDGANRVPGAKKKIFLPSEGFQGRKDNGKDVLALQNSPHLKAAEDMARRLHPAGNRLKGFALDAMSRNAFQLMGEDLASPSKVVVCYTDEGKEVGGTGQSLRAAKEQKIPVINLGDERWKNRSAEVIAKTVQGIGQGLSLDDAEKAAIAKPEAVSKKSREGDSR